MLFFLHGEDTYRSRKKMEEVREKFSRERDATGLNSEVLQGGELTADVFARACTTAPFMAVRRMVIVENVLTEGSDAALHQAVFHTLSAHNMEVAQSTADTPILVFWEGTRITPPRVTGKTRTKPRSLKELLFICDYVQEFVQLEGQALASWLSQEAANNGLAVTAQARTLLCTWYGASTWKLANELEKISAYVLGSGATTIDEMAVRSVSEFMEEARAFAFGNAIAERNHEAALALFWEHVRDGDSPFKLFGMIALQFRLLIALAQQTGEASLAELAKTLGVHPFALQKTALGTQRYTRGELQQNYRRLVAVERELRSGNRDQALTLARFLHQTLSRRHASVA